MSKILSQMEEQYEISIPLAEYDAIKGVAAAIAEQNALIIRVQQETANAISTLAETMANNKAIVIPPALVEVKAASPIVIPPAQVNMPAEVVTEHKIIFKFIRNREGQLVGMEGTIV